MKLFYKPKDAYIGDVTPFYDKDKKIFNFFYLIDFRKDSEEHDSDWSWYLAETSDFINISELGEAIKGGSKNDQDLGIWTGSVIKVDDTYHAFYCGGNIFFPEKNKPEQAICHAVSKDLLHWEKIKEHTFYAREDIYERNDFRDPFVFWNEEGKEYWMLVTARLKEGPPKRRGCLALCKSKDLENWKIYEPFWKPNLYYVMECPDLFKMGDWWYLIFSENNETKTHYRMSKSISGPWRSATNDTFDANSLYAAKTIYDGNKRYLLGWIPRKTGKNDYNNWEWGGNLIVHEIIQKIDGTLSVKVPDSIDSFLSKEVKDRFLPIMGNWEIKKDSLKPQTSDSFRFAVSEKKMPKCCKISAKIKFDKDVRDLGIMLRVSDDYEKAYYVRLEPGRNRLVFDMFPRRTLYPRYTVTSIADSSFIPGHERPIELNPGETYQIKIFVEDNICVTYFNNEVALTSRIYNFGSGKWGVFVNEGVATFTEIKVHS